MRTRELSAIFVLPRGALWTVLALLVLMVSGCATANKTWQVVRDPSIPVGYPEDRPSRVDLALLAESDVNLNLEGDGAPLRFQILQLKDDSMLMAADHYQLRDDLESALGTNYLTHDDFTLLPGQWKFYEPFELDEKTRYLGVIAFYSDPDQAEWKKVVKVTSRSEDYHLLVQLRATEVELRKEG